MVSFENEVNVWQRAHCQIEATNCCSYRPRSDFRLTVLVHAASAAAAAATAAAAAAAALQAAAGLLPVLLGNRRRLLSRCGVGPLPVSTFQGI